jgi:hypothetical protein
MELLINPALRAPAATATLRASATARNRHKRRSAAQDTENHSLGQVRGQVECFGIGRRVNLCEIVQMD